MPKRTPLVFQHLENISGEALARYEVIVRDYVRGKHGVYALYRRGKLYYVGLATNLRNRLRSHVKDRHAGLWDRFSVYLTVQTQHIKELESLLLRIVKPAGNRQSGKFAKSENLLRRFTRDIRAHHDREIGIVIGRLRPKVRIRSGGKSREARARPDLAGWFLQPTNLQRTYKGQRLRARVRRDGAIRFNGELYLSVSASARAARGRPTNGWTFWNVKNARGEWVRLREMAPK